jgi:hypothetical protein
MLKKETSISAATKTVWNLDEAKRADRGSDIAESPWDRNRLRIVAEARATLCNVAEAFDNPRPAGLSED